MMICINFITLLLSPDYSSYKNEYPTDNIVCSVRFFILPYIDSIYCIGAPRIRRTVLKKM